jgi:hypothetical protein
MKNTVLPTTRTNNASQTVWALVLVCGTLLAIAVGSHIAHVHSTEIGRQDSAVALSQSARGSVLPDLDETRRYRTFQPRASVVEPPTAVTSQTNLQARSSVIPADICGPSVRCTHLIEQNVSVTDLSSNHELPTATIPGHPY